MTTERDGPFALGKGANGLHRRLERDADHGERNHW